MVAALPQIPSLPWPASPEQGSVTWGSSRWVYTAWGRATPLWCAVCRPATPVPTPISSRGIAIAWAATRCTCSEIGRTRKRCCRTPSSVPIARSRAATTPSALGVVAARERAIGTDEGVLQHLFRVLPISEHVQRVAAQAIAIPRDEIGVGTGVAGLHTAHQSGVARPHVSYTHARL